MRAQSKRSRRSFKGCFTAALAALREASSILTVLAAKEADRDGESRPGRLRRRRHPA